MEWVKVNDERLRIDADYEDAYCEDGDVKLVDLSDGSEWYLAEDEDAAGRAVADYWQMMAEHDKPEFRAIIGDDRLVQWALGEPDSFGISSLEEFYQAIGNEPQYDLASYDHEPVDVDAVSRDAVALLGFTPTVAYRR